jgi:hypothetical protein
VRIPGEGREVRGSAAGERLRLARWISVWSRTSSDVGHRGSAKHPIAARGRSEVIAGLCGLRDLILRQRTDRAKSRPAAVRSLSSTTMWLHPKHSPDLEVQPCSPTSAVNRAMVPSPPDARRAQRPGPQRSSTCSCWHLSSS